MKILKARDLDYEKSNIAYDWQYPEKDGGGIKCVNYKLCKAVLPIWWWDCKNCYLCTNCDIIFGKQLDFKTDECPICLETKSCANHPNCSHYSCFDCLKRLYYSSECWYTEPDEPEFPYSDLEVDYWDIMEMDSTSQEQFLNTYPLLRDFMVLYKHWDQKQDAKFEELDASKPSYLEKCPICRQ